MDKRRILSTGSVLPIAEQILARFGQIEIASDTDEQSLISQMNGTIGLIVRGVTQISARVIESGSDLRVIGRTGVGYDNVNIKAATERGIPVVFTPGAGARAVAEGALAMILALVKKLPELDRKTRAGEWEARDHTVIGDLQGAVLGIIGLGRIGRDVARLARALDMRVISYDPEVPKQLAEEAGAELVDLDSLLKESDVITLHALLNEQTRGILNRDRLGLVKRGAVLVNLARGGLVESLDVIYEALNSGQLSAVGLDVYPVEPPNVSHPIFLHPNVLCSPHAMGLSVKAAQSIFAMVSRGMAEVLDGGAPDNVVNPEVFRTSSKAPGGARG
jgi:D-3-phosphoglycerate dehydrogenase / 2-oxoglutarate reductase